MNLRSHWNRRGNWQQIDSDLGLPGQITQALADNGVPVAIWSPTSITAQDGNVLPGPFVLQNVSSVVMAMFITDSEAQEAASALFLTAPRVAFAYVQAAAAGMLFVRGLMADRTETPTTVWEIHQAPVPYPIGTNLVGYKILVAQALQIPAGVS